MNGFKKNKNKLERKYFYKFFHFLRLGNIFVFDAKFFHESSIHTAFMIINNSKRDISFFLSHSTKANEEIAQFFRGFFLPPRALKSFFIQQKK